MNPVTTVSISDPEQLTKLAAAEGPILFQGPNGEYVRWASPMPSGTLPPGIRPPISDEDYEKLRNQPDGLPLAEVWKRIHERYGP